MAQALLKHALVGHRSDITVISAGTLATRGQPMEKSARAQLERLSAPLPDFRTQPVTDELVADADLVLTATRDHRAAVVRLAPEAAGRSFTLGEMSRLLDGAPLLDRAMTPAEVAALAASRRGRVPSGPPKNDDLVDPYGRSRLAFARCADKIDLLLAAPVAALTGPGGA